MDKPVWNTRLIKKFKTLPTRESIIYKYLQYFVYEYISKRNQYCKKGFVIKMSNEINSRYEIN